MTTDAGSVAKPFSSTHNIAKWLIILLIIEVPVTSISAFSDFLQIGLLSSIKDSSGSGMTGEAMLASNEGLSATLDLVRMAGLVVLPSLALFYIWFYKVYRNLPALGATELDFSPRWAVACFFIPILSLYKPFRAAEEIWKASDPSIGMADTSWKNSRTPAILKMWWFFWVMSSLGSLYYLRQGFVEHTPEQLIYLTWGYLATDIFTAIVALLTIFIVRKIVSRQGKKSANLQLL